MVWILANHKKNRNGYTNQDSKKKGGKTHRLEITSWSAVRASVILQPGQGISVTEWNRQGIKLISATATNTKENKCHKLRLKGQGKC